jgi:putative colanic acid biosynthesis UDP-glucose lipid carrier transferase
MGSLKKFLFRSDTVAMLFILQAILDGIIIFSIVALALEREIVVGNFATDTVTLLSWLYVSLWSLSVFIVYLIFGIGIVNRTIFLRQLVVTLVLYAVVQTIFFGLGGIQSMQFSGKITIFLATSGVIVVFRSLLVGFYKLFTIATRKQRIIIVGCNDKAEWLHRTLVDTKQTTFSFLGFFDQFDPEKEYFVKDFRGYLENVRAFCIDNEVSEIYYTMSGSHAFLNELKRFAEENFIFLGIIPDVDLGNRKRVATSFVGDEGLPVITYQLSPLQRQFNFICKRMFDIVFSSCALLVLVPIVFPLVALAIRADSPGPIFFIQNRPGKNTRLFRCYKFRTMHVNNATEQSALRGDARITRVGAFLRKTSLDELPQFFNVLRGDMSIVGPRPNLITHLELYKTETIDYSLRHTVPPGITGFAQVRGFRGEMTTKEAMTRRVECDMHYLENWSLVLDIKIIILTCIQVFRGHENAY